jgi:MFS family permease
VVLDLGPLVRHREFRLLTIGQGVSALGTMVTYVAVPYQVYRLTHSSLAVGSVGLVELAALLSMAFLGGALADAVNRRKLVMATEASLGLCAAGLAINASVDQPSVWPVFVLAGVMAGLDALQRPALDAMIPRLVGPDEMAAAAAVESFQGTLARIAGPAIAGVLLAAVGVAAAFLVDVATFGLSLVALAAMAAVTLPPDAARPSLRRVLEGLAYARSRPELLGTYAVDLLAMFFGMPTALFPAIAGRFGGAGILGLLYAAPSVGAFVASATSGWTRRVHRHGRAIAVAAMGWGVAIVVFGLATPLWLALLGLVAAGGADMVSAIFRSTLWNRTIPDALRGRLASVELISYSAGPLLGNAEAGVAASVIGVGPSVVLGGVACVVAVAVCAGAVPSLRAYDDRGPRR